jgi:hypothetical protein
MPIAGPAHYPKRNTFDLGFKKSSFSKSLWLPVDFFYPYSLMAYRPTYSARSPFEYLIANQPSLQTQEQVLEVCDLVDILADWEISNDR